MASRERAEKTTRRPTAKFYIFIAIVAAAVIAVVFFVSRVETVTVEQGEILFEMDTVAIIARDEEVVTAENYGKANFLKQEGERVEGGTPVAEVYKWGYNDNVMNELVEVQRYILQYQENELLNGVEDAGLTELNAGITEKAAEINGLINGGQAGETRTAERELNELMAQKQDYLNDAVEADQHLEQYYSKEAQLLERVDSWREVLSAPVTGVVSYFFDGAEEVVNAGNIQTMAYEDIKNVLEGSADRQPQQQAQTTEQPLFRLVNNFKWYLIITSEEEIKELSNETVLNIAFSDYLDKQYQGTVAGNVTDERVHMYMVEITEDIGNLLNERRVNARVFKKFEGLKVPLGALKTENEQTGVYVVLGDMKTFVPVNILIEQGEYAIVEPAVENSVLTANQQVQL